MPVLLSLILAQLFIWRLGDWIRKHAYALYGASVVIAVGIIAITWCGWDASFPLWITAAIWPMFAHGAFATAIFIIIMAMGAVPNGDEINKRLRPIRKELSFIACILVLGHNIAYGRTYFVKLFTQPDKMSTTTLLAAICSVIMIALMLILMVTSIHAVRKKLKARTWKNIQRSAYVFYGLIYIHIMLLYIPMVQRGSLRYMLNVVVYSIIFIMYAGMRIRKALLKKSRIAATYPLPIAMLVCVLVCVLSCIQWSTVLPAQTSVSIAQADAQEVQEGEGGTASDDASVQGDSAAVTYKDGTHIGTGEGYNGQVTVAVRVSEGQITSVTVVSTGDDGEYWDKAAAIIDEVVAAQSADVDAVSGATYSSNGLKEAIGNALAAAETDS